MGLISRVSSRTYRGYKNQSFGQNSRMNSALRFTVSRGLATSQQIGKGVRLAPTAQEQVDSWIHTNKVDVKRPMSPHLSVYKWSIPMSISGAYRVTSVVPLSAAVLLTPLVYEAQLLSSGNWDPAQSIVAHSAEVRANYDLSHLSLMVKKALLVSPLVFHMVNGCRHIRWDQWAIGIRHLEDVYKSGNIVLAVTLALSVIFTVAHW